MYEMDDLEWHEVRGFFEANGCVVVDSPELRWYQESWGALRRSDLTDTSEFEEDDPAGTMPKLRALCLLYMYLGMYQAAGEDKYYFEHPSVSSYLHSLGVDLEDIWKLAHRRDMLKADYRNYSDDDQTDDEDLYDIATQIVSDQKQRHLPSSRKTLRRGYSIVGVFAKFKAAVGRSGTFAERRDRRFPGALSTGCLGVCDRRYARLEVELSGVSRNESTERMNSMRGDEHCDCTSSK